MPRYFIHQIHRGDRITDEEGDDFADLDALRGEMTLAAREIMAGRLLRGEELDQSRFEVRDESGDLVLVFPFKDAIPGQKGQDHE